MTLPFKDEMGDLLLKKVEPANPSFRDALEMYCYRNKLHIPQNRAGLFYMIIGYISTLPYTKQFGRYGVKNIFQATDGRTIKVVVQYALYRRGYSYESEDYKAFVIHTDPGTPKRRLYANDREMVQQLVSKECPGFKKEKLKAAFEKVQHITIKRPEIGAVYSVLTDEGARSFLAHDASPLIVEAEFLPMVNMYEPMSESYMMLKVPRTSSDFKQLLGQIHNVFLDVATGNRLQITAENLLNFVQGALEFNYKLNENLKIRPYFDLFDNKYHELFLQKRDTKRWLSSESPIVIIARRDSDGVDYDDDGSVPSDFDTHEATMKETIKFSLHENGYFTQERYETSIAPRTSLVDQLVNVLKSGNQVINLKDDIGPVIQKMDLDSEFFFGRQNRQGEKFLPKYLLGQLMAYAGTVPIETFAFEYNQLSDNLVTFIIRRRNSADGVAIHILDDSPANLRFFGSAFAAPDYRTVGLTGKILNLYLDCRVDGSMRGQLMIGLSRLPLKSISAYYTYAMSSSFHAPGVFQKIDQQLVKDDLYVFLAKGEDFASIIDSQAVKAGLASKTSFELETLIKSFCLAKSERRTFLPYPRADPTIVGVHSIAELPVILMKCGVDVMQSQLLDDLRAVYMGDQKLPRRKKVIMKVMSVSQGETQRLRGYQEEYTNGVNAPLYDMCISRPSLARFRRKNNDFCRSTRYEENEFKESDQHEMSKEITLPEEIFEKNTIFRKAIQRHMGEVESFASALMHGIIAKNIVGAMIDGNYKEVAINLGFLTGSMGLGYAANYAALKGVNLAAQGSKVLGSCLRLASPFLARVSSAFVAYDLYKQIQTYNNGNKDALVGVVSDSVVLTIDVASVVVETFEALDLLGSSLSALFGPIGAAIGAVIFIGTDIYQAVKTVDRINSLVKLTAHEKLEQGLLAFVHASPDKYILDLMEAKQLNNEVAKRSMMILKNMSQLQIYGSPSLVRCTPQKSHNICTSGVKEVENNIANFTTLRKVYSRTWPYTSENFRVICANARPMESPRNSISGQGVEQWLSHEKYVTDNDRLALECNGFEAIFDSKTRDGNKAFLKAASGNDRIVGFLERSNVISFTSGNKYFIGGNRPDTFVLHGEEIAVGFIDGGNGLDTLDFSKYAKSELPINFYNGYKTAHFLVVSGSNKRLDIDRVERFIGRADAQDIMITNCNTTFLDLQGGTDQLPDSINIIASNNRLCGYNLAVELYHSTNVWNQACSGTFFYALNKNSRPGKIKIQNLCTSDQSAETIVKTNLPLRAVSKMERIVDDDDDDDQTRLEIQFENGIILLVVDFDLERTHFIFEDFNVKVEDTGIVGYKKVPMIENPYDMMQSLSELYHLNAVLMVEDENNQTKITTGHGRLIANAKSPEQDMLNANVLSNDLTYEHSMLVSGKNTENIFNIITKCMNDYHGSSCKPIMSSIFLEKNKTSDYKDIIDLSEMYHLMSTIGYTLRVTTHLIPRNKLFIQLWMIDRQTKENLLGTVTIHNIDKERLEKQLTINLNVGFHFHIESDKVTLKPVPLSFTKEMKLIILQPSDICEFMSVKILKSVGDFLTILTLNETHVILTNIMDPDIKNKSDDLLTLYLANYYKSEDYTRLFDTLSLEFNDGPILNAGELLAEKRNDIMDFEIFRDIVERLSNM